MQSHKHKPNRHSVISLWQGWGPYFRQGIWPAALALALLYLTVLSLGLLMTAYLKWLGMTEAELSCIGGWERSPACWLLWCFLSCMDQQASFNGKLQFARSWIQCSCMLLSAEPCTCYVSATSSNWHSLLWGCAQPLRMTPLACSTFEFGTCMELSGNSSVVKVAFRVPSESGIAPYVDHG